MKMRLSSVLVLIFGLMTLNVEAAKLKVRFVDHENKPVSGVESKLVNTESKKEELTKANKKGEAEFGGLEPGTYQVVAHKNGYVLFQSDSIQVSDKTEEVSFVLFSTDRVKQLETEGNELFQQQKFAEAVAKYHEVLQAVPASAVIWGNIAKAYAMSGELEKAEETANKAAELDPAANEILVKQIKTWTRYEMGKRVMEQKDFEKAVEYFAESAEADPNNAEAFYGLALAYGQQKKYEKALQNIEQALKLKPDESAYLDVQRILKHNQEISSKK
ncbi:MAG: tetratricopeptide repeat protein [Acidobacteriota bacterium]